MGFIGRSIPKLESWFDSFSVEVFASIIKPEWVQGVLEACGREGERNRKLSARFTLWLVLGMGLYRSLSIQNVIHRMGNLPGIGSLWKNGDAPTSASDTEARTRLGFGPLRLLLEKLRDWILVTYREAMSWKGMLLLVLDGTTFKVPDSDENRRRFGLPGSHRGRAAFPQMRALFLASAKLRFLLTGLFSPLHRAEIHLALRMIPYIPKGSLVILDRNFAAWQFLVGLRRGGHHFLVRAKDKMCGTPLSVLGAGDRIVEMPICRHARLKDPSLPKMTMVREISARIQGQPFRFFTSLVDPSAFRAAELVLLYAQRWQEELALDEIKTHQCPYTTVNRPVILRCKSSRRVLQEAYGLVLAYNLVRVLMTDAARQAGVEPLHVSFLDSLERIRAAALLMAASPTRLLPAIFEDLIDSIGRCVLPRRRRSNPRVVCVKMSSYRLKRKAA
jgi:hypothetical protein